VKYIFDHHDVNPELYYSKYERKDFFYHAQVWLERATFRCSDVVMSTNNSYREVALNRGGLPADSVFVVRNGVDPEKFKPVPANPALKQGKRFLVGYVGHMSTQEGLDILIDVALRLKSEGRTDVQFTCVGGGPGLPELRKLVESKNIGDMVTFTGRIPDAELLAILSTADICVNPDKPCPMNSMSTMIKIMEYMALGKPIVQFEGTEGRFSAQEASLYSDGADHVADFADKIVWLLDHPEERARMGEFGRNRIQKELAWEYSVEQLLAAYKKAFSKIPGSRMLQTQGAN
jgi:glycosyltransferase involved in cell wall biosynthesis